MWVHKDMILNELCHTVYTQLQYLSLYVCIKSATNKPTQYWRSRLLPISLVIAFRDFKNLYSSTSSLVPSAAFVDLCKQANTNFHHSVYMLTGKQVLVNINIEDMQLVNKKVRLKSSSHDYRSVCLPTVQRPTQWWSRAVGSKKSTTGLSSLSSPPPETMSPKRHSSHR